METNTLTNQVPALIEVLAQVPDHRSKQGQRHPLGAILATVVMAMLNDCRGPSAIAQWVRAHKDIAEELGYTDRRMPCTSTFHYIFKDMDVEAFEAVLLRWFIALAGEKLVGDAIRIDGKVLRGSKRGAVPGVCIVSAYADCLQSAIAQIEVARKTNEHKAAMALLRIIPLEGVVVTGDAAFTQRDLCEAIIKGGGDYYFRVKDNQSALLDDIKTAFAGGLSPLRAQDTGRANDRYNPA